MKEKLTKHFIATNSVKWVDVIDDIIYNYNHTVNRGIGVSPDSVNHAVEVDIINEKREDTKHKRDTIQQHLEEGDTVRLLNKKGLFDNKHKGKYTHGIFKVVQIYNNSCDIENTKGEIFLVKLSQLQKVKQNGEIIPDITEIEKANRD